MTKPTAVFAPVQTDPAPPELVSGEAFRHAFGEPLPAALDLATWRSGEDLAQIYEELERQVRQALTTEATLCQTIRTEVFPHIGRGRRGEVETGVYRVSVADIERVHRNLLFTGQVEAGNGTIATHDTVAATITQIGVCLVSYHGDAGTWVQRIFRRELREQIVDSAETALRVLEARQWQDGTTVDEQNRLLSTLSQRGILAYAERAALLERSTAPWRLGHGPLVPFELLSGSGSEQLLHAALDLLARLVDEQPRFVFVPSQPPERGVLTIGYALRPLEYIIVDDLTGRMRQLVGRSHYGAADRAQARTFVETYGPRLAIGLYRASASAPPQFFYAHADHVHEAALVALADSVLQEHRGFPTLLDLADAVCQATFKSGDFLESVRLAYADAGQPFGYNGQGTRG